MRLTNKVALLFSSAVFGATFAFAAPQVSQADTATSHAATATTTSVATTTSAKALEDGTYEIPIAFQKTGTKEESTMANFMDSKGSVIIKGDEATLTFTSPTEQKADMLTKFTINNYVATRDGLNWTVTLPTKDLSKLLKGSVEVSVPAIDFTEKQTVDIQQNISAIPVKPGQPTDSSSSTTDSSAEASKQKSIEESKKASESKKAAEASKQKAASISKQKAASISKQKAAEASKKKAASISKQKADAKKKAAAKKKADAKKQANAKHHAPKKPAAKKR